MVKERPRPYQYAFDFRQADEFSQDGPYRFVRELQESIMVRSPVEVAQYFMTRIFTPFDAFEQEELWALILNTKNRITHEAMLYRGSINTVQVRLAEVFKPAIRLNAAAFILAHNHPSSDPSPSREDLLLTAEIQEIAQKLDIGFLDHLVIGRGQWVSLKSLEMGFEDT